MNKYRCTKCGKTRVIASHKQELKTKCCDGTNLITHKLALIDTKGPVNNAPSVEEIAKQLRGETTKSAPAPETKAPVTAPANPNLTKLDQPAGDIKMANPTPPPAQVTAEKAQAAK